MNTSIELGRIRGIRIGVNWSWFVVFALIVWTLADSVFPSQNPGYSTGAYIAMAIVAALAFFASLLAHELGHAFVALREGMQIDGITLWLFGGVARFKGSFPTAGGEFRIAIAGPIVSLLIGGACVALAVAPFPEPVDGVLAWLGYINLVLLVFNLLPALPLDGGRVLRSALWKASGDFVAATRSAVLVSRGFGVPDDRRRCLPADLRGRVQRGVARVHRLVPALGCRSGGAGDHRHGSPSATCSCAT